MKVYLQPPQPSRGLQRITDALQRYAPATVEVVDDPTNVQLTVIYAIGRRDHVERQVQEILKQGRKYAVIQVCLKSTMSPNPWGWMEVWGGARIVWNYYNLQRAIHESAIPWPDGSIHCPVLTNFLHAPLGVDSQVFHPRQQFGEKPYVIGCSGDNRLQESIRECALAAEQVERLAFHLGRMTRHASLVSKTGLTDEELAFTYGGCEFVSGLRRTEGFELPAAEGLLCGAVPVLFDTLDYRWNYKHWGRYIKEGTRAEVVEQLVELFKQGAEPLSPDELSEARHWFNWERVCGEFWQRCLG